MVSRSSLPSRLLPVLLLVALLLVLGSCEILTGVLSWSLFPSFLSGVEATRDLGLELEDLLPEEATDFGCRIAVLRSPVYGEADYVFLLVNTPRGSRLLVLDANLDIVNRVDDGNFGERFMVDAGGQFLVGWERFYGPDDPVPDAVGWGDTYRPGVAIGTDNCLVSAGDSTLYLDVYTSAWGGPSGRSYAISSAGGSWNVAGLGYDGDPARAGREVMLALYAWDSQTLTVLFVDDAAFAGGSLADPLQDAFVPGQGFALPLDAVRRVHYTRRGVVVRTEDDDLCYLFDFFGEELHRFQLRMRGGVEEAYDREGEHFYYFIRDERILFKGRTGW